MTTQLILMQDLPDELGVCRERFSGNSNISLYLVATKPGGPPEAEKSVVQVLNHLHKTGKPIEVVFVNLDLSQKNGELQVGEIDLHPYRNFPDPNITKGIVDYFIDSKTVSGAWAFGVCSESNVSFQVCDNWYHWADFRESLWRLSQNAGKTEALVELLNDTLFQQAISYENLETLSKLLRLEFTLTEWHIHQSKIEEYLQELGTNFLPFIPNGQGMVEFFEKRVREASLFYEAAIGRAEALTSLVVEQLQQQKVSLGAIEIGMEAIDYIAELMRNKNISFVHLNPTGVEMDSMIDQAALLLNVSDDAQNRMGDMLSGKEIRTRIQVLAAESAAANKTRANEWAQASLNLAGRYEINPSRLEDLEQAEKCAQRALQLADDSANAWLGLGQVDFLRGAHIPALEKLNRAIQLEPLNHTLWRIKGSIFDAMSKTKAARGCYYHSIYVSPKEGDTWGQLGFHFHNHNATSAALYCLKKGGDLGDATSLENYHRAASWNRSIVVSPLPLLPPIVSLMNRLVLPMRYDKEFAANVRLIVIGMAFLIMVIAGAVYGTIAGGQAGGFLGGIAGFIIGALGAGILFLVMRVGLSFLTQRRHA